MDRVPLELLPVSSDQAWELMSEDFRLRMSLIAPKIHEKFQPEKNAVYSRRRAGGEGYWVSARADLEIEQLNEWAQRYFDACCEIWEVQGRRKCRAFYLAILHYVLIPLFDNRESFFKDEMQRRHPRLANLSAHLGHFGRQIGKLRSAWSTKIDIPSRDNEYQHRKSRAKELQQARTPTAPIVEQGGPVPSAFTCRWLDQLRFSNGRLFPNCSPVGHNAVAKLLI